jgi:hypothetical protein
MGSRKSVEMLLWLAKKAGYRLIFLPTMTNGNNAESPLSSVYFIYNPKAAYSIPPKTFQFSSEGFSYVRIDTQRANCLFDTALQR